MTKKNTDLRSVDGHTVYLPQEIGGDVGAGNIALPNIYVEDSVQKYPIGTRLEMGERTFRYYKAGAAITYLNSAIISTDCRKGNTVNSYDTSQAAGVGTAANPLKVDGSSAGDPALNYYAGHSAVIYVATALGIRQMQVLSSSASALDDGTQTVELVLDQATPMAIAANTGIDFFPSKFADCNSCFQGQDDARNGLFYAFVGIPMAIMTDGYWGWCQTAGPVFVVNTATQMGDLTADRTAIFSSDGSIKPIDEASVSEQIAGFTLADTDGSGSEWIQLQLE